MEIKKFEEIISEGIKLIVDNWPVDLNADQQREEFANQLVNYIVSYDVNKEDVEYFLLDFMEDNYSVEVGDDSEKYIASLVMKLIPDAVDERTVVLDELRQKAEEIQALKLKNYTQQQIEENKIQEEQKVEQKKEEETQKVEPVVDQDGFILVQNKKKERKNKDNETQQ